MRSLSKQDMTSNKRISIKELVFLALLGALMLATQVAMSALPNIHIVGVLIILTSLFFGWKALYSVIIFIILEGFIYGFGIWWFSYLYIWPLLVLICVVFKKNQSVLFWAVIAGIFGLFFGAMCAIPYFFIGGWTMAFSYWVSGIPFDLIHCGGNFVLTLVLLKPLLKAMEHFRQKLFT